MDAERWRQIDTFFKSAVELPSGERTGRAGELLTDLKRLKQQLEFEAAASRSGGALTTEASTAAAPSESAPPARSTDADPAHTQTGRPRARLRAPKSSSAS